MARTPEGKVRDHLKKKVEALGGEVRAMKWLGRNGAPDVLALLPTNALLGDADAHPLIETKAKNGQTHVIDIRGWGYLTGGGHGALNLEGAEAKRIQDARGVFLEALNPSVAKSLILRLQEVEDAIGDFVQATEDFRLFESTYPNDSTKRWDRVFEAKNDAYDRLAAILSAKGA
jgi:hypothetical protein